MDFPRVLAPIRDIDGVHGSFVLDVDGELLGRDLPPMFGNDVLQEAGSRVARLWSAFSALESALPSDTDTLRVRYGDHQVYVRGLSRGCLCVLTASQANAAALRMAANLVARQLGSLSSVIPGERLSGPPLAGPPLTGEAGTPVQAAQVVPRRDTQPAIPAAKKQVVFRGCTYEV